MFTIWTKQQSLSTPALEHRLLYCQYPIPFTLNFQYFLHMSRVDYFMLLILSKRDIPRCYVCRMWEFPSTVFADHWPASQVPSQVYRNVIAHFTAYFPVSSWYSCNLTLGSHERIFYLHPQFVSLVETIHKIIGISITLSIVSSA